MNRSVIMEYKKNHHKVNQEIFLNFTNEIGLICLKFLASINWVEIFVQK